MSWFSCGMSGKAVFAVLTLNLTNENAQFKNEGFLLLSVGKGGRALLPFEGWVGQWDAISQAGRLTDEVNLLLW